MMKDESKRKRTKKQIKDDEEAKLAEENANRARAAKIEELEYQLQQAQHDKGIGQDAAVLVSDLINAGVLKQNAQNQFSAIGPNGEKHFNYEVGGQ